MEENERERGRRGDEKYEESILILSSVLFGGIWVSRGGERLQWFIVPGTAF